MRIVNKLGIVILLGCAVALAALTAPEPLREPQTATAPAPSYSVDGVHSSVVFKIKHMGVSYFYGRFNTPGGEFRFDPLDAGACAFEIKLKTANIDTGNGRRDGHLKSADFFNAKQFPDVTFNSTKVRKSGDTYQVTGDLTMHGVTKSITVPLKHVGTRSGQRGTLSGFDTTFVVSRSDFGINYMPDGLGDEVTIMMGIEGRLK